MNSTTKFPNIVYAYWSTINVWKVVKTIWYIECVSINCDGITTRQQQPKRLKCVIHHRKSWFEWFSVLSFNPQKRPDHLPHCNQVLQPRCIVWRLNQYSLRWLRSKYTVCGLWHTINIVHRVPVFNCMDMYDTLWHTKWCEMAWHGML